MAEQKKRRMPKITNPACRKNRVDRIAERKRLTEPYEPSESVVTGAAHAPENNDENAADVGVATYAFLELYMREAPGSYPNDTLRGAGENLWVGMGRVLEDPEVTVYRHMGEITGLDVLVATYTLAIPRCHYVHSGKPVLFPMPIRAHGAQAAVAARYIRRGCMVHVVASLTLQVPNVVEAWPSRQIVTYQPRKPEPLELHVAKRKVAHPIHLRETLSRADAQPWETMEAGDDDFSLEDGLPVGRHTQEES